MDQLAATVASLAETVGKMQEQVNAVCSTVLTVKTIMDAGYEAGSRGMIAPARPALLRKRDHLHLA